MLVPLPHGFSGSLGDRASSARLKNRLSSKFSDKKAKTTTALIHSGDLVGSCPILDRLAILVGQSRSVIASQSGTISDHLRTSAAFLRHILGTYTQWSLIFRGVRWLDWPQYMAMLSGYLT